MLCLHILKKLRSYNTVMSHKTYHPQLRNPGLPHHFRHAFHMFFGSGVIKGGPGGNYLRAIGLGWESLFFCFGGASMAHRNYRNMYIVFTCK